MPLVGAALWATKRAYESSSNKYLFPRYCSDVGCKADHASNALNKWLKQYVPTGCVVHSFRHSIRDRLRAVNCPVDVVDQIGGWQSKVVGHKYGNGYDVTTLSSWMKRIDVSL